MIRPAVVASLLAFAFVSNASAFQLPPNPGLIALFRNLSAYPVRICEAAPHGCFALPAGGEFFLTDAADKSGQRAQAIRSAAVVEACGRKLALDQVARLTLTADPIRHGLGYGIEIDADALGKPCKGVRPAVTPSSPATR